MNIVRESRWHHGHSLAAGLFLGILLSGYGALVALTAFLIGVVSTLFAVLVVPRLYHWLLRFGSSIGRRAS